MNNFTPLESLLGGMIIGVASLMVLFLQGRIAGISGITSALFSPKEDGFGWKIAFLLGLVGGGVLMSRLVPEWFGMAGTPKLGFVALAGLLVGVGTRFGGGCTSGHGVCGISRFSVRSVLATGTFMVAGAITVWLTRHVLTGVV